MVKVLNTEKEDYHVHTLNYSDGMCTVDEIVRYAGEIGMKKVVFCDHSQEAINRIGTPYKSFRLTLTRWKNVHNDVEVIFGVEADIVNDKGDVSMDIQGIEGDFTILSYHPEVYSGDKTRLTEAFISAIERYHEKIDCIGHLGVCRESIDVSKIIALANKYKIPLELNCKYLSFVDLNLKPLMLKLLSEADAIYVNSDAHTLADFRDLRKEGFKFLEENGFL